MLFKQAYCKIVAMKGLGWKAALSTWVVFAVACSGTTHASDQSPAAVAKVATPTETFVTTRASVQPKASATTLVSIMTAPLCSIDDEARDLVREWNRVSGQLLASYVDTSARPGQYILDSNRLMPKLSRVVEDLTFLRECLASEERALFEPLLGTYKDKLRGYSALGNAVNLSSVEMEEVAIEILMIADAESVEMVCEIARITGELLPGAEVC